MKLEPKKILIVQTAFLGDVVLATSLIEKTIDAFPHAKVSVLVRAGAESLLQHHPKIEQILVWQKKKNKFYNLAKLIEKIRNNKYDVVINLQRYISSGVLTIFSGAKITLGFKSNPLSFRFTCPVEHQIPMITEASSSGFFHEVQRNYQLLIALKKYLGEGLKNYTDAKLLKPKLYFGHDGLNLAVNEKRDYVVIAPASVWFTKQWSMEKWIEFIKSIPKEVSIFLVGAKEDSLLCSKIVEALNRQMIANTCGKLTLLQTALLMKNAKRVFCNDSAPSHLASAVNAPQTVIFCSTVVEFGFGPLSDDSQVVDSSELECRPCGIHGLKACPKSHFKCAMDIDVQRVLATL